MRKIGIRLALLLLFGIGLMPGHAQGQTLDKGRILIDVYYGFPNLWTASLRTLVRQEAVPITLETRTIGPMGGRIEYLVSRRVGIGLDIYYANSEVSYTAEGRDLDGNPAIYSYAVSLRRPRVLLRGNFHFGNSDQFDPYLAVGFGYSGSKVRIQTDDPIFDKNEFNIPFFLPIAARVGFGTRYMFTDNIGISAEIGIGGPLITGGISVRI